MVRDFPKFSSSAARYKKSCCHGLPQGDVAEAVRSLPGFTGLYRADDLSCARLSRRGGDELPAYNRAFPSTGVVTPVVVYSGYGRQVNNETPSLCTSNWGFPYGSIVESPIGENMLLGAESLSGDNKSVLEISGLTPKELTRLLAASVEEIAELGGKVNGELIKNLQALAQALDGTTKIE